MTGKRWYPFDIVTRVLAERLRGREASDELCAVVCSQHVDWERVVGHASDQFALPAFAAALEDLGLIESLDDELGGFLKAVHAANMERNCEIRDELAAAVGVLNRARIQPVLLKGAIRLVEGLYPDHGWRMLRDLDLLIPEAGWADAIATLAQVGYTLTRRSYQEAMLERDGGPVVIEVHRELFPSPRQARLLRGDEVLTGSRPVAFGGVAARLPSMDHQVVHLIGHSQIGHGDYAHGRIALCDRLEAAALVHWGRENVDWRAVDGRFAAAGYRRPLLGFLASLNDGGLYAVPLPNGIDPLTALQRRRIAFQARSKTMAHIGLWAGRSVTKLKSQIVERDAGKLRGIKNINRLIFERGAAREMVRGFFGGAPRPW